MLKQNWVYFCMLVVL